MGRVPRAGVSPELAGWNDGSLRKRSGFSGNGAPPDLSYSPPFTGFGLEGTPFSGTSTPEVQAMALRMRVRQLSLSQVWW